MRVTLRTTSLLCCLIAITGFAQTAASTPAKAGDSLLQKFTKGSDLTAAGEEAEARLQHVPGDAAVLFVRMEVAELEERPELVLDSALRLCAQPANNLLQEAASNRVLQHAANTRTFSTFLRRIKSTALLNNACSLNLKLALVAAAVDGQPKLDLDQAARTAGLLTRWRIAGPFGHYNSVDFERRWPPEFDQLARDQYASEPSPENPVDTRKKKAPGTDVSRAVMTERFWFRDGMVNLPEYLFDMGTFYAASDIEIAASQPSQIEVLSSGAYAVFVDGKQALLHDVRYSAGPNRDSASLRLAPGRHRIVVKFTIDALPLSVALQPQAHRLPSPALPQGLEHYVTGLLAWFHGDFVTLEQMLSRDNDRNAAATQYLRALLYSATEEHSPRADAAWRDLATAQPAAALARLKSAENTMLHEQTDEVRQEVMRLLSDRPNSETALQLAFNLSRIRTEAPGFMARLLELHPSCARLAQAVKFYSSTAEQDKARQMEQQLASCAPESLQYARTLAEVGRNSGAAAHLQQLITRNPLHRAARRMLVEQLALSSQLEAAHLQAKQMREIAPNDGKYARLEDPGKLQDSRSPRAAGFTEEDEFYVSYRRDGPALVRKAAPRIFSGGSAVFLLSDKVIEVRGDGSASVYVHRLTRPLNKDGISHYGEVTLPRGADLLELRTIKASGQIIEPELTQQKLTVSMPALEPGDAIEEEYVTHYATLEQAREGAASLTFGSFAAPILYSRMVVLSSRNAQMRILEHAGAPSPLVGENKEMVVRIWERDNIAQTVPEPFLPQVNLLPTVTIAAREKTLDRLRDDLIDATRTGVHAHETVLGMHLEQAAGEFEKAKRLYRFVTTKIDSTGPDWAGSPAEDTLLNGQGSRTTALLALARTAGLKASLLLARKLDQRCGKEPDVSCYTEPLVRFWPARGEPMDVDAESDDLPFGAIPPTLDPREALLVPLLAEEIRKAEIVSLASRHTNEKSLAEGDLSFQDGDLVADIQIQLGPTRAQEVRSTLRNASELERQTFFEQLALRVFPGATAVTGAAANENDPEQPLKLSLRCTAQQFINLQNGVVEISQLAPALGLATLYAKIPVRKFPLYIDSLYFESTVFHLHLPAGMEARSVPVDFAGKSEFGEYSLWFVRSPGQVDIHRDFHVPVQVVTPEKYAAFLSFAVQIDEAEQQRISLQAVRDTAGGQRKESVQPFALKE
jgi:hypothetical protein